VLAHLELKMTLFFRQRSDIKTLIEFEKLQATLGQENIDILFNTIHIKTQLNKLFFYVFIFF